MTEKAKVFMVYGDNVEIVETTESAVCMAGVPIDGIQQLAPEKKIWVVIFDGGHNQLIRAAQVIRDSETYRFYNGADEQVAIFEAARVIGVYLEGLDD